MKKLFLKKIIFRGIMVFILGIVAVAVTAQEKSDSPIHLGIGSSIRFGTLLFPTADIYLNINRIQIESYYKYSDCQGNSLNSFGFGGKIELFYFSNKDFNLSAGYNFVTNSDYEFVKKESCSGCDTKISNGHVFFIGIEESYGPFLRLGILYTPELSHKIDPRIEFGYRYYFF